MPDRFGDSFRHAGEFRRPHTTNRPVKDSDRRIFTSERRWRGGNLRTRPRAHHDGAVPQLHAELAKRNGDAPIMTMNAPTATVQWRALLWVFAATTPVILKPLAAGAHSAVREA